MLIKVHEAKRIVIALCDKELLGKKFEEENTELDLNGEFFKGEEKTEDEIKKMLIFYKKEDASFNIVGKKSCSLALEIGLIKEENIGKIAGIPYSLILL